MATQPVTPQRGGPNTPEAFIADRQIFWSRFTRAIVYAVGAIVVLLILLAYFLA